MTDQKTLVLGHQNISQKLRRIAYQIYEFNQEEDEIIFIAIEKRGRLLAESIKPVFEEVSGKSVELIGLTINKKSPLEEPKIEGDGNVLSGKTAILIDDVLNSGRTLMYAARYILQYPVKKLSTLVLVDRKHRQFPIKADFVGLTLSTTLQEHVKVVFEEGNNAVYLE
jgi:pyrimidine operon attenuation protein/uracil phosphoribosyltransferase